jgi:hypothetical protein
MSADKVIYFTHAPAKMDAIAVTYHLKTGIGTLDM